MSQYGTYITKVEGPFSGSFPLFPIGKAEELYSQALKNALNFYENERDGVDFIKTPLRKAAGHLNHEEGTVYSSPHFDSNDLIIGSLNPTGKVIDASGGWWDAGDYLKFVQTHSYVVALMLIGVRDFPEQKGAKAGTANFTNEAKFGLRWLQKMWDDDTQSKISPNLAVLAGNFVALSQATEAVTPKASSNWPPHTSRTKRGTRRITAEQP